MCGQKQIFSIDFDKKFFQNVIFSVFFKKIMFFLVEYKFYVKNDFSRDIASKSNMGKIIFDNWPNGKELITPFRET